MREIYAYLRGKKEEVNKLLSGDKSLEEKISQPLTKHISLSLEAIDEIKDSKIWEFYVSLFQYNGNEYDEKTVEKWLRFSVVFHDLGKIYYQKNFKPHKDEQYLSFTGHEYLSTYLADRFMGIWLEKDLENRLKEYKDFRWVVCASILYHHHAMGLKSRGKPESVAVCKKSDFNAIIVKSYRILQKFLTQFEDKVIIEFANELKSLKLVEKNDTLVIDHSCLSGIIRYVDDLNARIWEEFVKSESSNIGFRKRMLLTTNILILADYKGAEGRNKKKPKFGEVLDEFSKLYKELSKLSAP